MKLTVVVPAHNEEENISKVISNIEDELSFPFELVVVNDHSLDGTAKIVLDLAKKYSNVSLVENNLPAGFANALKT
ncbi:MAG: glycosyltransferase, partial [Candidatus Omnitrophota bacterium]|nr:glycosyltransferase [Candidatus Omnitrophota bacterium]